MEELSSKELSSLQSYYQPVTNKSTWRGGVDLGHAIVVCFGGRALCRITLLPVRHVLVDTWMLTVKPVYKLLNVSDDLTWTTNTHT